jgi:hypothetical protein
MAAVAPSLEPFWPGHPCNPKNKPSPSPGTPEMMPGGPWEISF